MNRGDEVQFRDWSGCAFDAVYVREGWQGHRLIVTSPDWTGDRDIQVSTERLIRGNA